MRIQNGAYALGVAAEYAVTSPNDGGRHIAGADDYITIPPGQFALLLTEESVFVPPKAMAFISMKAKWKLRGLVNVSGFHVDPGYRGKLKFSVYNAGSTAIDLKPGQPLFLIWYADLDRSTADVYQGTLHEQGGITPDDVASIRGMVPSPAGLSARIDELGDKITKGIADSEIAISKNVATEINKLNILLGKVETNQTWGKVILGTILVVLLTPLKGCVENVFSKPGPNAQISSDARPTSIIPDNNK